PSAKIERRSASRNGGCSHLPASRKANVGLFAFLDRSVSSGIPSFPKSGKSGYFRNLHTSDISCFFPGATPPSKLETFRRTAIVLDIFSRAPAERIGFWF